MIPGFGEPVETNKVEALYDIRKQLYENKKHNDADEIFRLVCIIDPEEVKYLRAYAANSQALGDFEKAINMYFMAANTDQYDMRNFYNIAQCLILSDKRKEAIRVLEDIVKCQQFPG